jgi:hypothetical protein
MDLFSDPAGRDEARPFVKMLWNRGAVHEQTIISGIGFRDLSGIA